MEILLNRRHICFGASVAAVAPLVLFAQVSAAPRVFRIGVLDPNPELFAKEWDEFVRELGRRGYVEGRNVVFERRFGNALDPETVSTFAEQLVALRVDVIYATHGSLSALAAKKATRAIPIVFFSSADPVGLGLVRSLSRPGENVTGNALVSVETGPKGLQLLGELVGKLTRVVELTPAGTRTLPWFRSSQEAMSIVARRIGVLYEYLDVATIDEVDAAISRLAQERVDAVVMGDASWLRPHMRRVAASLAAHRLPSIGDPSEGFLLNYTVDSLKFARKSAELVDRILRGARPADLPVEQPLAFDLILNQKTAHAIGLKIPEALLIRASQLIQE